MLGVGLIGLRIMHLGIRAIYFLGRKRWNPVFYTSFLQIIRTEKKQTFISIFLIFTIAMGIFNANIARTIKQSDEERTYYDLGTDIVFRESWQSNQAEANKFNTKLIYSEPDYNRYQELKTQVDSITRVMRQDNLKVYYNGVQINDKIELMGIHTKEFGETAWMKDELMNPHWYTYLNSLGKTQNGILISQNLADKYGLKTGDQLKYSRIDEKEKIYGTLTSTIVGIVPIWPGFQQYHEIIQENTGELVRGESYLIVGNMQQIINEMGIVPYEIWVKNFGDNSNSTIVEEFLEANHISIEKYNNAQQDIMIHNQQATVQVTYGLLTLSFIISLVLCTIGFLIYWIMSIKQRELLLGIYRAMGMSMKQIIGMLLNEHVFSSLFSILIGILVGNLSSYFYVPLITIAYAPEKHVLPYTMASDFTDKIRIAIAMLFMLITCLYAIGNVVSKMKIAQALKLGED